MTPLKYIAFDLDGTLADERFDDLVWNHEVPKLYAVRHRISLEEAKKRVFAEYYKALYIEKVPEWGDVSYWFKRFDLRNWRKIFGDLKHEIFVYDDAVDTLQYLSKNYRLILISSAEQKFLRAKLKTEGLRDYFDYVFSAPSTFGLSKKGMDMYVQVLKKLRVKPEQVLMVGDDHYLDYVVPTSLGMRALHLVRSKKLKGSHVIHSLKELQKRY